MKNHFYLLFLFLTTSLLAQNNYVVTTPNSSTPGNFNTFIGIRTGINSVSYVSDNTFIGYTAGQFNTSGGQNTFLGSSAGLRNTTGSLNTILGGGSGVNNTTGDINTFVGAEAGSANTTGNTNLYAGAWAGSNSKTGNLNAFVGGYAGYHNITGNSNTFLGSSAGFNNMSGDYNTFLGTLAGFANTTGINNIFTGYRAGQKVTTGSNNIIIGPNSGTAITTSDDNVLMGYNSQADAGVFNGIAIGSNTRVAKSNALILGNGVNVGIGTSAPTTKLEVVSESADVSGLRLTNLTSHSIPILATNHFLTVNEEGDVVKARYQLRINNTNEWSDKVFSPAYQLRPLSSVESYIQQNGHLPNVPSAKQVAKEGVDLVRMNATLLEKVEELTLYSIQQDKAIQQQQNQIDELKQLVKQLLEKK